MKKRAIILLLIALSFVLSSCNSKGTKREEIENLTKIGNPKETVDEKKNGEETASKEDDSLLYDIKKEITDALGAKDYLDFTKEAIDAIYSIDEEDMKQFAGFSLMEGTFPHEVVMIEAKDEEAAQRIEKAFNTKIEVFSQQSKNYDPENYALAKKCKVIKNGKFYALFLSPDYETIKGIYEKHINN